MKPTQYEKDKCAAILNNARKDKYFGCSGRRNDDAVNLCIIAAVLEESPYELANKLVRDVQDLGQFLAHMRRIIDGAYIIRWLDNPYRSICSYMICSQPYSILF